MKCPKSIFFLFLICPLVVTAADRVSVGEVEFVLESRTYPENETRVWWELLNVVVAKIHQAYQKKFSLTDSVYEKINLSLVSHDLEQEGVDYIATIKFTGLATFLDGVAPTSRDLVEISREVFSSEDDVLQLLWKTSNPFLQDVGDMKVFVNGANPTDPPSVVAFPSDLPSQMPSDMPSDVPSDIPSIMPTEKQVEAEFFGGITADERNVKSSGGGSGSSQSLNPSRATVMHSAAAVALAAVLALAA